jgi:hypothetical protein
MLRFKSIVNNCECSPTVCVVGEDTNNMDTYDADNFRTTQALS